MNSNADPRDALDALEDAVAAAAFRRLVRHLRHRHDAQNIDLMGLAGFCRNCLGEWIADASEEVGADPIDWIEGREIVYGMRYEEWKARYVTEATPEQVARMKDSMKLNDGAKNAQE